MLQKCNHSSRRVRRLILHQSFSLLSLSSLSLSPSLPLLSLSFPFSLFFSLSIRINFVFFSSLFYLSRKWFFNKFLLIKWNWKCCLLKIQYFWLTQGPVFLFNYLTGPFSVINSQWSVKLNHLKADDAFKK